MLEITCRHATFLTSKKEEGKLSLWLSLLLYLHLKECGPCRSFTKQTGIIKDHLLRFKEQSQDYDYSGLKLSESSKSTLQQKINSIHPS
jgi:hypothetical protein